MDSSGHDLPPSDHLLKGLINALQALTIVVLDDEEKRIKLQGLLDGFFEGAAKQGFTDEQMKNYINGLSCVSAAIASSRN